MLKFLVELAAYRWLLLGMAMLGGLLGLVLAFREPQQYRYTTVVEFPAFSTLTSVNEFVQKDMVADKDILPRILAKMRFSMRETMYARSRSDLNLPRASAETTVAMPSNSTFMAFTSVAAPKDAPLLERKHGWIVELVPEELNRAAERRRQLLIRGRTNAERDVKLEKERLALQAAEVARSEKDMTEISELLNRRTDIVIENMKRLESEEALLASQIKRQESELDATRGQRLSNRTGDPSTALLIENDIERRLVALERLRQRLGAGIPNDRLGLRRELAEIDRLRVDLDRQNRTLRLQYQTDLGATSKRINELETAASIMSAEAASMVPVRVVDALNRAFEPEPRFAVIKALLGALLFALVTAIALLITAAYRRETTRG